MPLPKAPEAGYLGLPRRDRTQSSEAAYSGPSFSELRDDVGISR